MKRPSHDRPTSFRQRFAAGGLRFNDVVSIVLAGTASCALGLLSLDALLVTHPVQAEARMPAAAALDAESGFTRRDLGPYVGNWVSERGAHLIVKGSGAVWADGGALIGAARRDAGDGARLVFEGTTFRCSYRVALDAPDSSVWQVVDSSPRAPCPAGRYSRKFTF